MASKMTKKESRNFQNKSVKDALVYGPAFLSAVSKRNYRISSDIYKEGVEMGSSMSIGYLLISS